ncbi:hypothetical protein BJ322DRAFT_1018417 [Thelephora terrestris]|uniref:Uncharacterized protein n=1 Tax=Thelephora terrestris TaxID=56493 RepID=A0A9P6LAG7_9AGAM|nr:hypothetical protein BJ322DRAFT_1018417 [Thelephora terrestris]
MTCRWSLLACVAVHMDPALDPLGDRNAHKPNTSPPFTWRTSGLRISGPVFLPSDVRVMGVRMQCRRLDELFVALALERRSYAERRSPTQYLPPCFVAMDLQAPDWGPRPIHIRALQVDIGFAGGMCGFRPRIPAQMWQTGWLPTLLDVLMNGGIGKRSASIATTSVPRDNRSSTSSPLLNDTPDLIHPQKMVSLKS